MNTVHSTLLVLRSVCFASGSDFSPDELNALLSLQNRQGATQQLVEHSQTTQSASPEKVSFCQHFCGLATQHGQGCCVKTDGGMEFLASSKKNRDLCEKSPNNSVWCTAGQNPWPGTKGSTLMEITGWDCNTDEGWNLGGASGVVCDLPTLTAVTVDAVTVDAVTVDAVTVDVSPFTDPPLSPTPLPTMSPTPVPTMSPTPVPTLAPTPPPGVWTLNRASYKCTGKTFGQTTEASQYDCEQLAIQRKHPFYQYHAGKGLCSSHVDCFSWTNVYAGDQGHLSWSIYYDNELWPLKQNAMSCSGKKRDIRPAGSQMECQQAALNRLNPKTNQPDPAQFYTWNALQTKCFVSKKCKDNEAAPRFGTYSNV